MTTLAQLWEQTTITRELWEQIVSACRPEQASEYRRKRARRPGTLGPVELAFDQGGRVVVQTGSLLNVSSNGVMIKQREEISSDTTVMMRATPCGETAVLKGRVIHCTETVGGFKVGVELQFTGEGD